MFGVQNFTATPAGAVETIASSSKRGCCTESLEYIGACSLQAQIQKESQNGSNTSKQAIESLTICHRSSMIHMDCSTVPGTCSNIPLDLSHASPQKTRTQNICITRQLLLEPAVLCVPTLPERGMSIKFLEPSTPDSIQKVFRIGTLLGQTIRKTVLSPNM